jgi:hypothetical protein
MQDQLKFSNIPDYAAFLLNLNCPEYSNTDFKNKYKNLTPSTFEQGLNHDKY